MNIGIFFMHPPGESMGSIFRVRSLCLGLTRLSHRCFVFTPFNYYENWGPLVTFISIPVVSSSSEIQKQIYKTARKILDLRNFSNFSILNPRFLDIIISRISNGLLNIIKEKSMDLDVIIGETEIGGLILTKIKNKLNCPIITDYQNYWPEELVEHKIIKRYGRRYKYLIELEKKVINKSDMIFTVSDILRKFLLKNYSDLEESKIKTEIIGSLPIFDKPRKKEFPPKIINSGMVVHRSNFKYFFKSLPFVLKEYPETHIYVTKKGEKLKETMKLAKKMKLNVNFYWKDTYQEFIELLSQCHVGIVTSTYELTRRFGFVTKIYDYLSVGIPIVGNDIGGWIKIVEKEKLGLLSSKDPKDLAEKILFFINNPDMTYEYGERGIEFLKKRHNVKYSAQKIIDHIQNISHLK
ncbi:MAG: glycosyltransferase [Candidatus Hermodarchaeota archaeon]